ncbi:hypothetical protein D5278_06200 [bacterium 1XD21-13]|nr:hypothetical protein [bacterium 1XD21-13]
MKKLTAMILMIVMTISLMACSNKEEPKTESPAETQEPESTPQQEPEESQGSNGLEGLVFGYSKHSITDPWHQAEVNSIQEAADQLGCKIVLTDAQGSTEQQVSDIEDLIAQDVDFLIVSPGTTEGYDAVYEKAKEKNIPIMQIDRQTTVKEDGQSLIATVVSNHYQQGFDCGQWLVDHTADYDKVNVVEIQGSIGGSDVELRTQGFADAIQDAENIEIVAMQTGEWSRNTAQQVMQNLIQSLGDGFQVVYAQNDTMALGAIAALKASGYTIGWDAFEKKEGVLVLTIDGQTEAVESMLQGNINFIAACSPDYSGIFDIIASWYNGETPEPLSYTPDYHFLQENVEAEGLEHAYDYGVN